MATGLVTALSLGVVVSGGPALAATSIRVQSPPATTLTQEAVDRSRTTWPWYLTRASGLVAAGLLFLLLLSGMGLITGHTFRVFEPLTAWATHKALGLAFCVAILVHGGSLLLDRFVPFNLWQALVPFASGYKPVVVGGASLGSLWVALGVIAMYLVAVLALTSWLWIERKTRVWRLVHYVSYAILGLIFFHALMIGSDLKTGWAAAVWLGLGAVIIGMVVVRLRRAGTT